MKRIFALLLVLCLSISVFAVALTACNNNDTPGGTNTTIREIRPKTATTSLRKVSHTTVFAKLFRQPTT